MTMPRLRVAPCQRGTHPSLSVGDRLHCRQQIAAKLWFEDVPASAGDLRRLHDVPRTMSADEEDPGCGGGGEDSSGGLEAAQSRKFHVEQDQVGLERGRLLDRVRPIVALTDDTPPGARLNH